MAGGKGGAGYSRHLLSRAQALLDDLETPLAVHRVPYEAKWAWGPQGSTKSSPNHEAMAWTIECARAALHGTAEQLRAARDVLLSTYYPQEFTRIGLWTSETLAPANHDHQHLCGTSFARLAAYLSGDAMLLYLSAELCRRTARLFKSLATPDGEIWSVGLRSHPPLLPQHRVSGAWLRLLRGDLIPLPDLRKNPALWHDRMYAGLRALRWLLAQDDDLGAAAAVEPGPVPLKHAVTVYRAPDRHLVVLEPAPALASRADVCDWIDVPYLPRPTRAKTGKAIRASGRVGFNFERPAPDPPRDAVIIRHPGRQAAPPKGEETT